jgi:hypothetical protein
MKSMHGKFMLTIAVSLIFNACHHEKPKENMKDQNITIIGTARNGKGGALILTKEDSVYYVDGLDSWDGAINGREISVTGILKIETLSTNEMKNVEGEWKAGIVGDKKIIHHAKWKLIAK